MFCYLYIIYEGYFYMVNMVYARNQIQVEFDNTIHKDGYSFLYLNINKLKKICF